ncbi:hypothetical protein CDL12_23323 [Handroanthus impetiginosus]|uniref:Putative plant transposon protein domain-containing protein n=1 Tax=Handroanthus impetiginosus TaxID=429701 RepID=A0A2G9GFS3_9LAMI|nr:hypothetical protein CDL12_23323 [Handroanthus impetiginosus]
MSSRCSAKRRQTDVASTSQGFDQQRFISREAENYYNERLLDRTMVREGGIQKVDEIAKRHHWEDFVNDSGVANKTLVRVCQYEIHRSATSHGHAINSLFGTLAINTPKELQEFLEDHLRLDTICKLICRDNPQWTLSRLNEPIHFSRTKLTTATNNWLRFISALLLLTTHTSEVTRERAVMTFAILTDVPFDIDCFLDKSILNNELLQPDSMIRAYHRLAGRGRAPIQPCQQQPPQAGLEEWLQQEQQFAYQQQWWALWADQMHIPMSNCPRYPPDEPIEPLPADIGNE